MTQQPVFRFAPSPNGRLHLGHALSALLNDEMARRVGGAFLLRIEDIDQTRARPEFEAGIIEDLDWLGLTFPERPRRQSEHLPAYRNALDRLAAMGLVYPSTLSRAEIRAAVAAAETKTGQPWPRDPDGAPLYPGTERDFSTAARAEIVQADKPFSWRLDMARAIAATARPLTWLETGAGHAGETGVVTADPAAWGDVILSRSDAPSSYHLSVTVDDAEQGVTHVVRGRDLFHATSVHRLIQTLLGLPVPVYHHHRLILGPDGRKLSKSNGDTAIAAYREAGMEAQALRALVLGDQG
ncbi:glutamyl-Q tRNA(Asp) synthetase [Rhizobium sp. RU20A]|uniref:tRNA glutamyl-Q(34) synthetase GluQRS n=1 Tax=Rhizobium sp. RU20A TaxID=1907412 RepID=UPI000955BB99|nr:tRNA glutamyl-Q(34) synthetase GluQRS [Rhizobium sp. RU20A]SIQ34579.1 glutamyl-Q tRNA(Asp) synthetase [Rhizobium sp. RU20A]